MYELSLVEMESELSALLPERNLMCVRHAKKKKVVHHSCNCGGGNGGTSANASYGSAANANSTSQVNSNAQTVVNTGTVGGAGVRLDPSNANANTASQSGTPLNFGIGG